MDKKIFKFHGCVMFVNDFFVLFAASQLPPRQGRRNQRWLERELRVGKLMTRGIILVFADTHVSDGFPVFVHFHRLASAFVGHQRLAVFQTDTGHIN